jgi:hypothetical protein
MVNKKKWVDFFNGLLELTREYDYLWEGDPSFASRYLQCYANEVDGERVIGITRTMPYKDETATLGIGRKAGEFGFYLGGNYYGTSERFVDTTHAIDALVQVGFCFDNEDNFQHLMDNYENSLSKPLAKHLLGDKLKRELADLVA